MALNTTPPRTPSTPNRSKNTSSCATEHDAMDTKKNARGGRTLANHYGKDDETLREDLTKRVEKGSSNN